VSTLIKNPRLKQATNSIHAGQMFTEPLLEAVQTRNRLEFAHKDRIRPHKKVKLMILKKKLVILLSAFLMDSFCFTNFSLEFLVLFAQIKGHTCELEQERETVHHCSWRCDKYRLMSDDHAPLDFMTRFELQGIDKQTQDLPSHCSCLLMMRVCLYEDVHVLVQALDVDSLFWFMSADRKAFMMAVPLHVSHERDQVKAL
jgi:hypothetical protein